MLREINQPNISPPERNDPLRFALYGKVRHEWLLHIAPQLELDSQKLVLGNVLVSITRDNFSELRFFNPKFARYLYDRLLTRLDWEKDVSELPDSITEQLEEAQEQISQLNFSEEVDWKKANALWVEKSNDIKRIINEDTNLSGAVEYYFEKMNVFAPYFEAFLLQ